MSDDMNILSDETLLQVCRISQADLETMPALADELRVMRQLIPPPRSRHYGHLEYAMTMLGSALGKMPQYAPAHLHPSYSGPGLGTGNWIDREDLDGIAKQIVGLTWLNSNADDVDCVVSQAISNAVNLSLIEQKKYDAWCPGMSSGSGWRLAVSATTYGATKARALAEHQAPASDSAKARPLPHRQQARPANNATGFYLFAETNSGVSSAALNSTGKVFYHTSQRSAAESLCRLFTKEYCYDKTGSPAFRCSAASAFSPDDQVLLDKELEGLHVYGAPDIRVYDPPPPKGMHQRAEWFRRAEEWERLLEKNPAADPSVESSTKVKQSSSGGGNNSKEYRVRIFALSEARGLLKEDVTGSTPSGVDAATLLSVEQAASNIAAELDVWVEAVACAEADKHSDGGFETSLDTDLEDILGPADLGTGIFEDIWTPLLTGLRIRGQSDIAKKLERLARDVVPKATQLARNMDAVAYLTHGGPKDVFYLAYSRNDLATHQVSLAQGRRDVMRDVKTISSVLRTLSSVNGEILPHKGAAKDQVDRVMFWLAFIWFQKYTKKSPKYRRRFCDIIGLQYEKKPGKLGIDTLERWSRTPKGQAAIEKYSQTPEVLKYIADFKRTAKTSDASDTPTSK